MREADVDHHVQAVEVHLILRARARQVDEDAARWEDSERLLCCELHARRAEDSVRKAGHTREITGIQL